MDNAQIAWTPGRSARIAGIGGLGGWAAVAGHSLWLRHGACRLTLAVAVAGGDDGFIPRGGAAMTLTDRETWTLIHGMILGALFLLGFAGGLEGLYGLRPRLLTAAGVRDRTLRLRAGVVAMTVAAWGTVITGTWIVYPWYREPIPDSPRSVLLADPATADWHHFGMEWKEHIAWISPILSTVVAFIVLYYGTSLVRHDRVRKTALLLFVLAFLFAAVAGAFGALITKAAPVV